MQDSPAVRLMQRVRQRLQWVKAGQALFVSFLVACGLSVLFILAVRLSGYGSAWMNHWWWVVVPVAMLLGSLAFVRRVSLNEAARRIDRVTASKDLFLTLSQLANSAGAYQPLVLLAAEKQADGLKAARVVPFAWQNRYWNLFWPPALVLVALYWVPQLDPFGKVAEAKLVEERADRLQQSRKATQLRLSEVKQAAEEAEEASQTDEAIKQLQQTFNKMKPREKQPNLRQLLTEQKRLGELYQRISEEKLKEFQKNQMQGNQNFGSEPNSEEQKWSQELAEGSGESIKQELQEVQELLQQMAQTQDTAEKEKMEQKLREKLDKLEKFASEQLGSEKLASALQQAKQQLDMAKLENLSQEAREAAAESLELAAEELKDIVQGAEDLKEIEQALRTLQQARNANEHEMLDGEQTGEFKSLEEYEEFYAQMVAQSQQQQGGGGNGAGEEGTETGAAPDDDAAKPDMKTEQSQSPKNAGKVIFSMKTKGVGETGDVVQEYKELIGTVKQGVSEAILQEQVPPAYHERIKTYFDSLDKSPAKP